jgi:hypothetical protein
VGAAAVGVEERVVEVEVHINTSIIRFPFWEDAPFTCCLDVDEDGQIVLQSHPDGPFRTLKEMIISPESEYRTSA